jgi:hypothetical protein
MIMYVWLVRLFMSAAMESFIAVSVVNSVSQTDIFQRVENCLFWPIQPQV